MNSSSGKQNSEGSQPTSSGLRHRGGFAPIVPRKF